MAVGVATLDGLKTMGGQGTVGQAGVKPRCGNRMTLVRAIAFIASPDRFVAPIVRPSAPCQPTSGAAVDKTTRRGPGRNSRRRFERPGGRPLADLRTSSPRRSA